MEESEKKRGRLKGTITRNRERKRGQKRNSKLTDGIYLLFFSGRLTERLSSSKLFVSWKCFTFSFERKKKRRFIFYLLFFFLVVVVVKFWFRIGSTISIFLAGRRHRCLHVPFARRFFGGGHQKWTTCDATGGKKRARQTR